MLLDRERERERGEWNTDCSAECFDGRRRRASRMTLSSSATSTRLIDKPRQLRRQRARPDDVTTHTTQNTHSHDRRPPTTQPSSTRNNSCTVHIYSFQKAAKDMIWYMPLTCCAINEQITLCIANIARHKSRKLDTKNYNNRIHL